MHYIFISVEKAVNMATFYSPFVHLLFGLVCVTAIEHNPIYQQFVDWAETTTCKKLTIFFREF